MLALSGGWDFSFETAKIVAMMSGREIWPHCKVWLTDCSQFEQFDPYRPYYLYQKVELTKIDQRNAFEKIIYSGPTKTTGTTWSRKMEENEQRDNFTTTKT